MWNSKCWRHFLVNFAGVYICVWKPVYGRYTDDSKEPQCCTAAAQLKMLNGYRPFLK